MKKSAKVFVILCVLVLEFLWAVWPRISMHGAVLDEPYRNAERRSVLFAWIQHKTPETKSAYDAEVALLNEHILHRAMSILIAGLAFDAVGILLLLKYVPTKTTA
jgi:hypothetical protein